MKRETDGVASIRERLHGLRLQADIAIEPGPADAVGDECSLLTQSIHAFADPINAFCVTLYNERHVALEATLRSLVGALDFFHARTRGVSALCIVADGMAALDPGILQWLKSAGLLNSAARRVDDADLYFTFQRLASLARRLGIESSRPDRLRVVVCLKRHNRGKLQSHAVFFDLLCRGMQPRYCFQIDAGTTLESDTVSRLVAQMESRPNLAAIAPNVLPPLPKPGGSFLAHWQFCDFAYQKSVLWPFELAMGHLSVIPGQACVLRWRALQSGKPEALQGYLRGLRTRSAAERIMYLAEDRVICNEIALSRGSEWRLGYEPGANATTDACESYAELFHQRRRWSNSALLCRLWLLGKRPRAGAALAQAYLALRELLFPAQFVAWLTVLAAVIGSADSGAGIKGAFLITLAAWVLGAQIRHLRTGDVLYGLTAALYAGMMLAALPASGSAIALSALLSLPAALYVLPVAGWRKAVCACLFPLPNLALGAAISGYSIWNLHDVSWGTKGLTRDRTADARSKKRLRRWRALAVATWGISNVALIATATLREGWTSSLMNPVAEIFGVLDAGVALVALAFYLRRQ